jgi:hypothetical protein
MVLLILDRVIQSFRSRLVSYFENYVDVSGYFSCKMPSVAKSGADYVGVQINTSQGSDYISYLYIMYGTFTGFHRVFTEDEKFNKEDPQKLKDDYLGRIVVSTSMQRIQIIMILIQNGK